jgi:predicted secreted protein
VEGDAIAGFRTFTLSINQATIDATSADSSRWDELIVGRRSAVLDIDVLYIYDDIAQKVLDEHINEGSPAAVTVVLTMPDGRTYTGEGIVTSLTYNIPYEDVVTAAASISITDGLTTTTS